MTTKLKKPKLDLLAIVGPFDQKEEPRTLMEIYEEVGFPFTARAVLEGPPGTVAISPIGYEDTFIGVWAGPVDFKNPTRPHFENRSNYFVFVADYPRWTLLGHK